VLVAALGAAAVFVGFAQEQNRAFREDSLRLVNNAIAERGRALANTTLDFSSWNDAYQHISVRWDSAWIQNNYYSAVADGFVIYRKLQPQRYAWIAETRQDMGARLTLGLLRAAQSIPNPRALERAPTAAGTVMHALGAIDGNLAMISVGAITPEDDQVRLASPGGDDTDFLASVKLMTPEDLAELGNTLSLANLHFETADAAPEEQVLSLPLYDASGEIIGTLRWRDQRPGDKAFAAQLLPVVLGLLFVGVLALLLARALVMRHVASISHGKAAADSSRLKSEFIATMTHELRTPLNAIIGYAELIQEEGEERADYAFAAKDAGRILTASRQLRQLVDDTLDQTRIDAGHLKLAPARLDIADLLKEIDDVLTPLARANGDALHVAVESPGMYLIGDHQRVRQCLLNVASNAIKFTKGGDVTLRARHAMRRGTPFVTFDVYDTGIGIAPEHAKHLFEPFTQANYEIHQIYGGVGLGLAIARKLARAMGGDIDFVSELGRGSCFSVHLPVGLETQPTAASAAAE
jgi:signal transduction histidine kinase